MPGFDVIVEHWKLLPSPSWPGNNSGSWLLTGLMAISSWDPLASQHSLSSPILTWISSCRHLFVFTDVWQLAFKPKIVGVGLKYLTRWRLVAWNSDGGGGEEDGGAVDGGGAGGGEEKEIMEGEQSKERQQEHLAMEANSISQLNEVIWNHLISAIENYLTNHPGSPPTFWKTLSGSRSKSSLFIFSLDLAINCTSVTDVSKGFTGLALENARAWLLNEQLSSQTVNRPDSATWSGKFWHCVTQCVCVEHKSCLLWN